jgi:mRNA-degrading endonuclease RelE of RelBE toxin-antitoxin system
MIFPDYSKSYSKDAKESRKSIAADIIVKLEELEDEMTDDPENFLIKSIPASRSGETMIYMHSSPRLQITYEVDKNKKVIYFYHFAAPEFRIKDSLFVSYSHKDVKWLEEIRKFLSGMEQEGSIRFWDDSQLIAGVPWKDELVKALETASAGVLLVSQDFLKSEFIRETELPKLLKGAEEKGKKIFWIHISPSTVFDEKPEITKFQSLLDNPRVSLEERSEVDRKRALVKISKSLRDAISVQ